LFYSNRARAAKKILDTMFGKYTREQFEAAKLASA
jgi:hypothetical protein